MAAKYNDIHRCFYIAFNSDWKTNGIRTFGILPDLNNDFFSDMKKRNYPVPSYFFWEELAPSILYHYSLDDIKNNDTYDIYNLEDVMFDRIKK